MSVKNLFTLFGFLLLVSTIHAQGKYFTKTGKINFYSQAPLEDIEAINKTVMAVLDAKTGTLQFTVQMKSFEFEKKLMQEHFNANYVESDKYPKAEFKGSVANNSAVNYTKEGTYKVAVKGKLTIHGVTKEVSVPGKIVVDPDKKVTTNATFKVALKDYNIKNDKVQNISNDIEIRVNVEMPKK